jgi:hypothetical protein
MFLQQVIDWIVSSSFFFFNAIQSGHLFEHILHMLSGYYHRQRTLNLDYIMLLALLKFYNKMRVK